MDHLATMIAHFGSNHERGCSENFHLWLAVTLSTIDTSGQRELGVPKYSSQRVERGAQGLCIVLFSACKIGLTLPHNNIIWFLFHTYMIS